MLQLDGHAAAHPELVIAVMKRRVERLGGMREHSGAVVLYRSPLHNSLAIATPIWEVNQNIYFLDV